MKSRLPLTIITMKSALATWTPKCSTGLTRLEGFGVHASNGVFVKQLFIREAWTSYPLTSIRMVNNLPGGAL
jgi:hypothetical protein